MIDSSDSRKISEIRDESELQKKIMLELLPDLSDPICAKQLDKKINSSTGEMKELWLATKELCNGKAYTAEAKFVKFLPELAKKIPEYSRKSDPVLDSDIHNIQVFVGVCELLTKRYIIADKLFKKIGRGDGAKCDDLFSRLNKVNKNDSDTRQKLLKQLGYQYKLMYTAMTGEEFAVVGETLAKQREKNPQLLALMESNREKLKFLIRRNAMSQQTVSYKDH